MRSVAERFMPAFALDDLYSALPDDIAPLLTLRIITNYTGLVPSLVVHYGNGTSERLPVEIDRSVVPPKFSMPEWVKAHLCLTAVARRNAGSVGRKNVP